jgi:energy-coupling factor transporter ATP-binding protein EcfA2
MLARLSLKNFRGFYEFDIAFGRRAVLIGPNNAGKSTIIAALRAAEHMLRHARARNPRAGFRDQERHVWGYPMTASQMGLDEESLRFNSRDEETRFDLQLSNGAGLHAVWGPGGAVGFFHLTRRDKLPPRSTSDVRASYPSVACIPPLSPVERAEALLDPATLQAGQFTRRSSRHLRNNLYALTQVQSERGRTEWDEFAAFSSKWLPGITLEKPRLKVNEIELDYWEGLGQREIAWAGDGIQIFIQFLYHCYRLRDAESIVIDEPDIYLHADLQRRLMKVLETMEPQYVLATHAAEIATEAPPRATIWIDRDARRAVAAETHPDIDSLIALLGINFNLRLAPLLRARVAVFVEGDDTKILRALARTLNKEGIGAEVEIVIVPMEGASNWRRLVSFNWLLEELLHKALSGYVILDRDYKSQELQEQITSTLADAGLTVHFWQRHEMENYLLVPSAIQRATGMPANEVVDFLRDETLALAEKVLFDYVGALTEDPTVKTRDTRKLLQLAADCRGEWWSDESLRTYRCPGKELLRRLNDHLRDHGYQQVSASNLAKRLWRDEVPQEVVHFLNVIEP